MHQQGPETLRLRGKHARRDAVDEHREPGLGFGLVDGGVRGRVHDEVRLDFADLSLDGVSVAEFEVFAAGADDLAQGGERSLQFPADLSVLASDEDSQGNTSAWRSGVPRWSLSFKMGLATGHLIATSGSLQSNTRSSFGE